MFLSIEGLWWRYPTFSEKPNAWVLRGIDLQVAAGECFGITGASGAGKTTLCRAILGAIPTSSRLTAEQLPQHFRGEITLAGERVSAKTAASNQVGMVLQDPENQFLRMSVLHELALGLQMQGMPEAEMLSRSYAALAAVGLEHLWPGAAYLHPADLSGGQKQRIAIAAFLALRPRLLILDEPTSDLDPQGKREVIETIARLRREYSMTILLVEQDPDILATFCDRIALLDEGRIELLAPPAAFYAEREVLERSGASVGELTRISWQTGYTYHSHPPLTLDEAEAAFAKGIRQRYETMNTSQGTAPTEVNERTRVPVKGTPTMDLSAGKAPSMVGVPFTGTLVRDQGAEKVATPVITAQDITYTYEDGTVALQGADLTLYRGEMLALLGPNGSGKTTLAKILAGIYRPTQGRVEVLSQDLASRKARRRLPTLVGYVFQNPDHQLFRRRVSDELAYGLINLGVEPKRRREIVADTLEAVGLTAYANEDPLFLGKGQRQRLAVAAILAMGPEIFIVDEPTTGQDYRMVTGIMDLLRQLQKQGKTILIITHDMSLVANYCQRAIAFRAGRQAFTGTPAELFEREEVLRKVGLEPPPAAALSARLRKQQPQLPFLLTVEQWVQALT